MANTSRNERVRLDELKKIPTAVFTDRIYFSKFSVKLGTKIRNFGRTSYGTTWEVVGITTITSGKYGRLQHDITEVRTLEDIIRLHCVETGDWKTCRFGYLSEAARWRLD